jgi:hypothetical protein
MNSKMEFFISGSTGCTQSHTMPSMQADTRMTLVRAARKTGHRVNGLYAKYAVYLSKENVLYRATQPHIDRMVVRAVDAHVRAVKARDAYMRSRS